MAEERKHGNRLRRYAMLAWLLATTATVTGCEFYPLGMSKQEWERLSPAQQYDARQHQAAIDLERERIRAEEARREAAEKEALRRRIEALYADNRIGDVLDCTIENGLADFHPGWDPFPAQSFSIAREEEKDVRLTRAGGQATTRFWVSYAIDGRSLKFCRYSFSSDCTIIPASFEALGRGVGLTVDDILNSTTLRCRPR